jgi:predicted ATPase
MTVLSSVSANERQTAFIAKHEMSSWKYKQLEPTALRQSDDIKPDYDSLAYNGSHMPSVLSKLLQQDNKAAFYIRNDLRRLIDNVDSIGIENDESNKKVILTLKDNQGRIFKANSLSDGTLRFLYLLLFKESRDYCGLAFMEEPENGLHPAKIPDMIELLDNIATRMDEEPDTNDETNLRQVIVNTHSDMFVKQCSQADILWIDMEKDVKDDFITRPKAIKGTWRTNKLSYPKIDMNKILAYLNPVIHKEQEQSIHQKRLIDNEEIKKNTIYFSFK